MRRAREPVLPPALWSPRRVCSRLLATSAACSARAPCPDKFREEDLCVRRQFACRPTRRFRSSSYAVSRVTREKTARGKGGGAIPREIKERSRGGAARADEFWRGWRMHDTSAALSRPCVETRSLTLDPFIRGVLRASVAGSPARPRRARPAGARRARSGRYASKFLRTS